MATSEHCASPVTPFQTLLGGRQKLRLNPSSASSLPAPQGVQFGPLYRDFNHIVVFLSHLVLYFALQSVTFLKTPSPHSSLTEACLFQPNPLPSRSGFLSRLHVFFPRSIGGHSMRSGGATSLAAAGVPPSQIQAIGRWRSDTFECYIHRHPTLLQAVLFHGWSIHDPPFANVS